jgi:DNA repair exonuclease SbcCD ATPase subunit
MSTNEQKSTGELRYQVEQLRSELRSQIAISEEYKKREARHLKAIKEASEKLSEWQAMLQKLVESMREPSPPGSFGSPWKSVAAADAAIGSKHNPDKAKG